MKALAVTPRIRPEAIDELEAFEYSVSDAGNVKMSAPPGIHDDIVMALALATFIPGRFNPNAKVDPRVLRSGRREKRRRTEVLEVVDALIDSLAILFEKKRMTVVFEVVQNKGFSGLTRDHVYKNVTYAIVDSD